MTMTICYLHHKMVQFLEYSWNHWNTQQTYSHPGQLSLAIPSWLCTVNNSICCGSNFPCVYRHQWCLHLQAHSPTIVGRWVVFSTPPMLHRVWSKGKGSPIHKMSVGFQSWSRSSAVSLQVTEVIKPVVGCHYFPVRPAVTSVAEHHRPLAGTKLYCLVTEARVKTCPGLHLAAWQPGFLPVTCWSQVQLPNHSVIFPF